jgi:hypothetical protein
MMPADASAPAAAPGRPGWDALLLAVLLLARLRINSMAEASLFEHFENVTRHSLLGRLLSDQAEAAFGPWFGDPIALLLAALSLAALLLYLVIDLVAADRPGRQRLASTVGRVKLALVWLIIAFTVLLPTLKLALLRHENLPHSYSHDGGVLQTEAAIDFFLSGRNPYVEDYRSTPMADWGLPEFRTALDHYPYLPWTFVFSAPMKLASDALLGWYDQRFVYLLVFVAALILATRLAPANRPRSRLALLMLLGLNPLMGLDLIFGQNDLFVWAWIVLALWFLARARASTAHRSPILRTGEPGSPPTVHRSPITDHRSPITDHRSPITVHPSAFWLPALFFGLACASKPTAWFMAPFFALLLVSDQISSWRDLPRALPAMLRRGWPALAAFALLVGPYLLWNADALIDDVWRWASGSAAIHYQIWGWGASNFVLAFGGLASRFDPWPFWVLEVAVTLPLLLWLGRRQARHNTLAAACWHYALLLFGFLYVSRFLNENYLGYILAFLAMGYLVGEDGVGER